MQGFAVGEFSSLPNGNGDLFISDINEIKRQPDNAMLLQVRPATISARSITEIRNVFLFRNGVLSGPADSTNPVDDFINSFTIGLFPSFNVDQTPPAKFNEFADLILNRPLNQATDPDKLAPFLIDSVIFFTGSDNGMDRARDLSAFLRTPTAVGGVDTTRGENYLFAAGDVDGDYEPEFDVERFFISAGLEGEEVEKVLEGNSVM